MPEGDGDRDEQRRAKARRARRVARTRMIPLTFSMMDAMQNREHRALNADLFTSEQMLPDIIVAPRTDPIYNAHGYLTKVPVDAIVPYILTFTAPGETVVDLFAGSGMTAVAARVSGRSAVVSDISALGRHIGLGYLTHVSAADLRSTAATVMASARRKLGDLYFTKRATDEVKLEFVRTIWSFVYRCVHCAADINYFRAMAANNWNTPTACPHCRAPFQKRGATLVRDEPVSVVVDGQDSRQVEQEVTAFDREQIRRAEGSADLESVPNARISPDREMHRRSALGKWGLENTRQFFSARNALALYYLWQDIQAISDASLRRKLLFAFTAILPRASRRYQWSRQRPLNAATQNYYIAPVYFEWNVFELFERKVEAAIRADEEIAARQSAARARSIAEQSYVIASAADLGHLEDESVDYVFTDPPFGSNLFYADMNLFQEAWLGEHTNDDDEAVIHTGGKKGDTAALRYEELLSKSIAEAHRVLKPGRHMSLVFGNSSGRIWSMVQRCLRMSGFDSRPVHIGILDKGQRSVKGLNSGSESVATLDLVLTVRKSAAAERHAAPIVVNQDMATLIENAVAKIDLHAAPTASHVYLTILKQAFACGLDVAALHLSDVLTALEQHGLRANAKSGRLEAA